MSSSNIRAAVPFVASALLFACGDVSPAATALHAAPVPDGSPAGERKHDASSPRDSGSSPSWTAVDAELSDADAGGPCCTMNVTGAVDLSVPSTPIASVYTTDSLSACLSCVVWLDGGSANMTACVAIADAGDAALPGNAAPQLAINGVEVYSAGSGCVVHVTEDEGLWAPFAATFECDSLLLQADGGFAPSSSVHVVGSISSTLVEPIKG